MQSLPDNRESARRTYESRTVIDLPLEVKAGGMPGEFEGYGAVFGNIDRDGDVVVKGAFADSLKAQLPALLWQHNPKEPIGRFDVVREDEKGLFVKGRLSGTGKGAEAYELLKMGALNGLSIGFVTREAQRSSASGTRNILRADLMEVSLVTFPANELARVQTVKQKEPTVARNLSMNDPSIQDPRTFERFLRENGFSRSRAKAITAKGFKGDNFDGDTDVVTLVSVLKNRQQRLEQKRSLDNILSLFETAVTPVNRVSVFPGKEKNFKIAPVKLGRVTFEIDAPSWARFTCFINFYEFRRSGALQRQIKVTDQVRSVTIDRGRPPSFNPLKLRDWFEQFPGQLVLDSTDATLVHHEHEDESIASLPQNAGRFAISVR